MEYWYCIAILLSSSIDIAIAILFVSNANKPGFSHCANIEVEPKDFGELPYPKAMPTFWGVIL